MTTLNAFKYPFGTILLLNTGGMHDDQQHQAQHIHQQVAFASLHLLGRIAAAFAPFSVVFTD